MKMPVVELSNTEKIRFFVAAFDEATEAKRFETTKETWLEDTVLDVVKEMGKFERAISHNDELHRTFMNHVMACDTKLAAIPEAAAVRDELQKMPGFALNAQ